MLFLHIMPAFQVNTEEQIQVSYKLGPQKPTQKQSRKASQNYSS